jgi:threonine dehydrogenase-like Zn-dependent dehydrogenase
VPASPAPERGTVRAAVMRGPGEIGVECFEVPEPGPGAVVLRVSLSGVCGTDKHTFRGETIQYAGTPHERQLAYPLICGHENVGVVEAVGGDVRAFDGTFLSPGDRIVPGANVACGACWYCSNDQPYYLCERLEDYGNSLNVSRAPSLFGGWAELMYLLPGTPLFRVPDELEDELAVLTEPMAVTHGVEAARNVLGVTGGESVVVLGVGPLGLCHLLKSHLTGCGELMIRGADVVHDCSGVPDTFGAALRMARPGGVVVESGDFVDLGSVEINPNRDICTRSVTVIGIGGERATSYGPSLDLLAANRASLPVDRIVTHRLPLGRAAEALELSQREGAMKVVLDPTLAFER